MKRARANALVEQGRPALAAARLRALTHAYEDTYGVASCQLFALRCDIARALAEAGDRDEASAIYAGVLEIASTYIGVEHEVTVTIARRLVSLLERLGDDEAASDVRLTYGV